MHTGPSALTVQRAVLRTFQQGLCSRLVTTAMRCDAHQQRSKGGA